MKLRELFYESKSEDKHDDIELDDDPELDSLLQFATRHYPSSKTKQLAFMKYVQHSLKHSLEDDIFLKNEVSKLNRMVNNLENKIKSIENNQALPIKETKLRKDAKNATPNEKIHPTLNNSNPYHSYRFGVALASAPDHDFDKDGPIGQHFITVGYSDADDEIIKKAEAAIGAKGNSITTIGSEELGDINTCSPVAKPKKNKYGV